MPLAGYAVPFGLRQVKLVPLDNAGAEVVANGVMLPASRTFSFGETEEFETLEGDDRTIASHGAGPTVDWDLEGGGISLEAWKILSGGAVGSTGTTPNVVKTFTKLTSDARPYFNVYGRAISDSGGDFEMRVFRCKADGDLEASLENGSFLLTSASGKGYGNEGNAKLYELVHRETPAALTDGTIKTGWSLTTTGTPTGGTFRLLLNGYSTPDIAFNAAAATVATALNGLSGLTGMGVITTGGGPLPTAVTITLPVAGNVAVGAVALTPSGAVVLA